MSTDVEIQIRSLRHAALRVAQRALGEAVDPADLQPLLAQGREVRDRLRALSERAEPSADPGGLRQVDRGLDRLNAETLDVLRRIGADEQRHLFRRLAEEQPDAVLSFCEVVIDGDPTSDGDLRLLEFLVTLACCERRGAEKAMVRTPLEAVPALERSYARRQADLDRGADAAEQTFLAAAAALVDQDDVGEMRDRMRRAKRMLGMRMLHPRVLESLVAYNVAMSNRVEALIDEGGLQDALKQELRDLGPSDVDPSDSLFDSDGFRHLVDALTRHVKGEPCGDGPALRLARRCDVAALAPGEIESFATPEEASDGRLLRAAVALGLVLSRLDEVRPALGELGIDPAQASGAWAAELRRAMTAAAQNLLADGRFAEAQRLAAVRTRQLAEHRVGVRGGGAAESRVRPAPIAQQTVLIPVRSPFLWRTLGGVAALVGLLLFAALEWPSRDASGITPQQLARLSPHLASAHRTVDAGTARLVGTAGDGWRVLSDAERRQALSELGVRALAMGIANVSLVDAQNQLLGRSENGEVVWMPPPRR